MFQGMTEGALIYVLNKSENKGLKIGQVVRVSNPHPKDNTFPQQIVVDVIASFDGEEETIKALPSMEMISEDKRGVVFCDNQETMKHYVMNWVNASKKAIDSIPYHEEVLKVSDSIMRKLDPQIEAERLREEKFVNLERKVEGMEGTLTDIRDMLNAAFNQKKKSYENNKD